MLLFGEKNTPRIILQRISFRFQPFFIGNFHKVKIDKTDDSHAILPEFYDWFWFTNISSFRKFPHVIERSHTLTDAFCKKGALRNFVKFTGKHLCQSLFFDKVAGLRPATLLKKNLWRRWFPVNFTKFLRPPFSWNTFGRLLLPIRQCTQYLLADLFKLIKEVLKRKHQFLQEIARFLWLRVPPLQ